VHSRQFSEYTDLTTSVVTQRQSVSFAGTFDLLHHMLIQVAKQVEIREGRTKDKRILRVFDAIDIIYEPKLVTIEWVASPVNDMYSDAALTAILQADSIDHHPGGSFPDPPDTDHEHFKVKNKEELIN